MVRASWAYCMDQSGKDSKELVEIINLKFDKDQALDFAESTEHVYPAYHMNKRNWITIALDESLPDEMIFELIKKSYLLTDKQTASIVAVLCAAGTAWFILNNKQTKEKEHIAMSNGKILVVYFSRADENYNVGTIEVGNTELLAKEI